MRTAGIERVWLTPDDVQASEDALAGDRRGRAHRPRPGQPVHEPAAEPAHARRSATRSWRRRAPRVFVCNVATQAGETTGYDLAAHVEALVAHTSPGIVDVVLANNQFDGAGARTDWPAEAGPAALAADRVRPRRRGSSSTTSSTRTTPHHHDPARLAAALLQALERETGRRRRTVGRTA